MKTKMLLPIVSVLIFLLMSWSLARASTTNKTLAEATQVFDVPLELTATTHGAAELLMPQQEESAEKMQNIRGKFVAGNQIAWFGIVMLSQWQTNQGAMIQAGGQLTIQKTGSLSATATYQPMVSIQLIPNGQQATQSAYFADNFGLGNASGVVQGAQVAGNNNIVSQDANIRIAAGNANPNNYAGVFNGISPQNQMNLSKYGMSASSVLNEQGMQIQILVPGSGVVMQALRNGMGAGGRGLLQSAQLTSDGNVVHSIMQMNIQTSLTGAAANQLQTALQGMIKNRR